MCIPRPVWPGGRGIREGRREAKEKEEEKGVRRKCRSQKMNHKQAMGDFEQGEVVEKSRAVIQLTPQY